MISSLRRFPTGKRPRGQAIASASRDIWSSRDAVGTKMISSQPLASNAA